MKVCVSTNIHEQKGLYRDWLILEGVLKNLGHEPFAVDFREGYNIKADVTIHCEVPNLWMIGRSKLNFWVVNLDWCKSEYLETMPKMDKVLCKTHNAYNVMKKLETEQNQAVYTGFMSEDHYAPEVTREKIFFHAKRGSIVKGTEAIIDSQVDCVIADGMTDTELWYNQNRCLFHLQPSHYEGYGHALTESLSCGAILVTTDVPPMNEYEGVAYLIPPIITTEFRLATCGLVDGGGVRRAVEWCKSLSDEEIHRLSVKARMSYLKQCAEFKENFAELFR